MTTYVSPFTGDVIQPTDVSYVQYTTAVDLNLYWPVNGISATLDVAARVMEIEATASGVKVYMPPANQISVGQDALIRNIGSNTFTVVDYDGNTIISVTAGKAQYIYVTDNATQAGTWGIIDFGAGTSSADAATLAGAGLLAISTTLNQSHPTSLINDGDTFNATDRAKVKVWYGGAGTAYLPLAADVGDNWFILFKNNGTGTLNIETQGLNTLDNQPQKTFQPDDAAIIICNGSDFVTVGYGQSPTFLFTALVKPVVSGSYYLTASEASSIIQEYTGTLTGNVTVYYPPVVALYVVANQTTAGGYSLTLTTGVSGGANAVIPAGQQATLACDGINFFNANTIQAGAGPVSLPNGTVALPSLSFAAEPSTGMYRPGSGVIGFSVLGTNVIDIDSTGITATGTGTFLGGVLGGTF